jgi:diguanylate cyclase (GGDEF)-like protein/PAS domain S-box-containing protein/hemerythrin-like metal-binding protein
MQLLQNRAFRLALSLLPPLAALALQSLLWDALRPFVWSLFYPAVLISGWLGGLFGGLLATLLSIGLVLWFFMEPLYSLKLTGSSSDNSIVIFALLGCTVAYMHHRYAAQTAQLMRTQEQAKEALARFRELFEQAPMGIALVDSFSGRIHELNQRFAEITGRSRQDLANVDWQQITHPDDLQADMDHMARLNAGEISGYKMDKRYVRPDGAVVWVSMTIAPVQPDAGHGPRHLALIDDISKRRQTENALIEAQTAAARFESEQRFSAMADQNIVGVAEVDLNGRYTFMNERFCVINGHPREALLGMSFLDITHPDDRTRSAELFERLLSHGEGYEIEKRNVRADGQIAWVYNAAALVRNAAGQPSCCTVMVLDVSERKRQDERLRESELRFRNLFMHLPVAYQALDSQGRWLDANPRMAELLGFETPEQMLGKNFKDFWSGENPHALGEFCGNFTSEDRINRELNLTRRDGKPITVLITSRPQTDCKGAFQRTHCILIDISERRAMEAQIRELNVNLESTVVARTAELARANEGLRRLARRDALTELPNRLAANERLHSEFISMKRLDTAYAVLMIDIDFFKRVNDTHGHAVGDQVLQRVAQVLRLTLRESDFIARFGGEEFIALLPATELAAATRVAEKIRQAVEAAPDPTAGTLTLSVGVAIAHHEQASEKEAVLDADNALYFAKNQGRNQVQLAPESLARAQVNEAHSANLVHLVWREVYKCGNAVIDAQHRALFKDVNQLLSAVLGEREPQDVLALVQHFIADVLQHFQEEEAILTRAAYPGLAAHAELHRALIEQAGELSTRYGAGTLSLGELFAFLARDLVAHHMLVADREFFAYLASKN